VQCDKPRNRSPQGFNPRLRSPSPKKEWKFFKLQWAEAVGRSLVHSDDIGRPPTIKDQNTTRQTKSIPAEVKLYQTTVNDKEAKTL
jgi:hypothetical protein